MRLWHIDIIPYLPKSQLWLLSQWRELNSIFKKQDKHILINYIYDYDKKYLWDYTLDIMGEFGVHRYNLSKTSRDNFYNYFNDMGCIYDRPTNEHFKEHDNEYLTICYYNLKEKYLRGQKDFTQEQWHKIEKFYKETIKQWDTT